MGTTRTTTAAQDADAAFREVVTAADKAYRSIASKAMADRNAARKVADAAYNEITRAARRDYDAALAPAIAARRAVLAGVTA
jgi:hypothetical protein